MLSSMLSGVARHTILCWGRLCMVVWYRWCGNSLPGNMLRLWREKGLVWCFLFVRSRPRPCKVQAVLVHLVGERRAVMVVKERGSFIVVGASGQRRKGRFEGDERFSSGERWNIFVLRSHNNRWAEYHTPLVQILGLQVVALWVSWLFDWEARRTLVFVRCLSCVIFISSSGAPRHKVSE